MTGFKQNLFVFGFVLTNKDLLAKLQGYITLIFCKVSNNAKYIVFKEIVATSVHKGEKMNRYLIQKGF